jgi:hypothetical protein
MVCVLGEGGVKTSYSDWMEKREGQRDHMRDLGSMLKEWNGRRYTGLIWFRIGANR